MQLLSKEPQTINPAEREINSGGLSQEYLAHNCQVCKKEEDEERCGAGLTAI